MYCAARAINITKRVYIYNATLLEKEISNERGIIRKKLPKM